MSFYVKGVAITAEGRIIKVGAALMKKMESEERKVLKKLMCVRGIFLSGLMIMTLLSGCAGILPKQDDTGETDFEPEVIEEAEIEEAEQELSRVPETMPSETSQEKTETAFELTDKGKAFLERMCRELGDFNAQTPMNEDFWQNFLFYSYTGASSENAEMEQIYREDLGFEETVVKVSLQEVEAYAELVFGIQMPDIKPSFEEMKEGQTSCFYKDGYYYIGVSDFPDYQYTFAECTVHEETDTCADVIYSIDFEGESNVGTVSFVISPEDNENGFVIRSKTTDL